MENLVRVENTELSELKRYIPGLMTSNGRTRRYGRFFIVVEATAQNGKREAK